MWPSDMRPEEIENIHENEKNVMVNDSFVVNFG